MTPKYYKTLISEGPARSSLKRNNFLTTPLKNRSPISYASFDTFGAKSVDYWLLDHSAPKFIKLTYLKEIQTLVVEYIIDQFWLTRFQKKRYEQCDGTFIKCVLKQSSYFRERWTVKKYIHMKYFGVMLSARSVVASIYKKKGILCSYKI